MSTNEERKEKKCLTGEVLFFMCLILGPMLSACTRDAPTSDLTTLSSFSYAAVPGDDAPELAHLGPHRIGVKTLEYVFADQDEIALLGYITGNAPKTNRRLSVDVIYPAEVGPDIVADAVYPGLYQTGLTTVEGLPKTFEVKGMAVRDAPPSRASRFPLVVVSHGLFNTPGVLIGITENLASKGYVVAAIDHGDASNESDTPLHTMTRVMLNRSLDQQRIVEKMLQLAKQEGSEIGAIIDTESIGILGFSMGGYGVLNHAGAGYNPEGKGYGWLPGDILQTQSENDPHYLAKSRDYVDAAVTFAPWGGQPDADMWTASALSNISTPLLILAGSQDDVSNFDQGILPIFNNTGGTDRFLVVFQNALHNIVQVPAPPSAHLDVVPWQTFEDPTWRRERLLSVGAHFVTAFFDWHLKGIDAREAYFNVPTTSSNDATWEQPFARDYSDVYADGENDSGTYWKGFKRRQALGLELHKLEKGVTR